MHFVTRTEQSAPASGNRFSALAAHLSEKTLLLSVGASVRSARLPGVKGVQHQRCEPADLLAGPVDAALLGIAITWEHLELRTERGIVGYVEHDLTERQTCSLRRRGALNSTEARHLDNRGPRFGSDCRGRIVGERLERVAEPGPADPGTAA